MKKARIPSLFWVILFIAASLAGCGAPKVTYDDLTAPGGIASSVPETTKPGSQLPVLDVTVMMENYQNPFGPIKDEALWDYIRDKAAQYTGYRISLKRVDWDGDLNKITAGILSNSLPDVLVTQSYRLPTLDRMSNGEILPAVEQGNVFRPLTPKDLRQNMPNLVKRVEKYGLDFDTEFLPSETIHNQNWYIPYEMIMTPFSDLPEYFTQNCDPLLYDLMSPYYTPSYDNFIIRDDILKMIYPEARTEQELRGLYVEKEGKLAVQDVTGDIPIRTLDDLYKTMVQIRDLNLMHSDGSPLIPAEMCFPIKAAGLYPSSYVMDDSPEGGRSILHTPEFKTMMKWINQAFQQGLLDPNYFTMNSDERYSRMTQGGYAITRNTGDTQMDTMRKNLNCGFRLIPMGYDVTEASPQKNRYVGVSARPFLGIYLNANLPDDKAAAIMRWLDYQMSEEFDELCYWGLPEWSEGEGESRRFTSQHADLETWTTMGDMGQGEGTACGILSVPVMLNRKYTEGIFSIMPPDVRLVSFFSLHYGYPEAPCYTIPMSKARLENASLLNASERTVRQQDIFPRLVRYLDQPDTDNFAIALNNMFQSFPSVNSAEDFDMMALITCGTAKFEKKWNEFQKNMKDKGLDQAETDARNYIAEHWQTDVLDRVID